MKTLYRVTDIKITEKKNISGTFYDVDNLTVNELEMYIGELVMFENKLYLISTIEHDCFEIRKKHVYKGKKIID